MAEKILKGIIFPGLEDTYIVPEVDDTLSVPGASADAKVVGEALSGKQPIGNYVKSINGNTPDENGNVTIQVYSGGTGDGSSGGSVEQVQSDWSVTDVNDPAYIKNKPFGEGAPTITEIFPATEIEFTFDDSLGGYVFMVPEDYIDPTFLDGWNSDWETIRVVWDGDVYDCPLKTFQGFKCIGDTQVLKTGLPSENGEPFVLGVGDLTGSGTRMLMAMSIYENPPADLTEEATVVHSVSLSIVKTNIIKIPEKYLPDNLGTGSGDSSGPSLPEIDSSGTDAGKVLTVGNDGSMTWSTPEVELPAVSTEDNGKVLEVVGGTWSVKAPSASTGVGLPTVSQSDNGKFLRVVNGVWAAVELPSAEEASF